MAALSVEPAYAFNLLIGWGGLMVEHLKVLNSRACLRILMVEREIPHHRNGEPLPGLSLTVEPLPVLSSPLWSSPLKGDGGLISRACLRIQFTYWVGGLMVEHLKVLNSRAC